MCDFTEYDEIRLKEIFEILDVDKSGNIDLSELRTGCQMFGLNPSSGEIGDVRDKLEEGGTLSYEEFTELVGKLNKSNDEVRKELDEALLVMMKEIGLGEDEKISKDNFKAILQVRGDDPMTEEEIDEVFREIDKDGDTDTVTRQELIDLFSTEF